MRDWRLTVVQHFLSSLKLQISQSKVSDFCIFSLANEGRRKGEKSFTLKDLRIKMISVRDGVR